MTHDWQAVFGRALHKFGDAPGSTLEQKLIDLFQLHPQAVSNAIEKIVSAHDQGKIRSPWGALATEVDRQIQRDVQVDDRTEARTYIQRAEQWIRNAGRMYPSWDEALEEIRSRPKLQPFLNPALEARLAELWHEQHEIGLQIEADEHTRAERWKATRAAVESIPKHPAGAAA